MRHKSLLWLGLGALAACDAYDASLLSSSRLGAPTAVKTDDIGEGAGAAGAEPAIAGAGAGASAADGGGRADGDASASGGDALAEGRNTARAGTGGTAMAGAGGRAGAAGSGTGGTAANGGGRGANAGQGGAGDAGRSGDAGAGAGGGGGTAGAADGGGCGEPGSVTWSGNGHCYFPLSALATWNVSRDACSQHNAQLVTITSSDEQAFVAGLVGATPRWIGLSKFGAPAFTWIDGEALSYTNWDAGAPAVSGEVAAALRDGTQKWFDDAVTASHAALCERP